MNNELQIQIVQNLVPVLTAGITIGGGQNITFGDTMTGTGTPTDPVNVSNDVLQQISDNTEQGEQNASQIADIRSVIPSDVSATNPLSTRGYVNSTVSGYLPTTGGTLTGRIDFARTGTAGNNLALIAVQTADGLKPLFGADTDDNGVLRDTAVINKLKGDTIWYTNYVGSFIGNINTPVTRIHVKKITSGGIADAITIPAEAGTMARIEDIDSIGGDGTAGQVLTKTDDGMAWQDAASGGDYLPLSGGTLTGPLSIVDTNNQDNVLKIGAGRYGRFVTLCCDYSLDTLKIGISSTSYQYVFRKTYFAPQTSSQNLGSAAFVWNIVFAKCLNNGADLAVPTEGGTLARMEDITAAVGDISTALTAILGE